MLLSVGALGPKGALLSALLATYVNASIVSYEGDVFPEEAGWERVGSFDSDRWIEDGWFYQHPQLGEWAPGPLGEADFYQRSLAAFAGAEAFFVEWVVVTDGVESFGDVAPAALVASGQMGIWYHFTIAEDQVLLLRDPYVPSVWVDIEPGVPHAYRLELYGQQLYRWYIDGQVIDSGVPEGPYPTADSRIVFGARASIEDNTTRWDYIRFGVIPEVGSGDYDSDEDVDLGDFYFVHECGSNSGPDNDAGPGCRFADMDQDDDVDLHDFALFQRTFTGGE